MVGARKLALHDRYEFRNWALRCEGGFYHSEGWGQDYAALQILQIQDLLAGESPNLSPARHTFKKAPEAEPREAEQLPLDLLTPATSKRQSAQGQRGATRRQN